MISRIDRKRLRYTLRLGACLFVAAILLTFFLQYRAYINNLNMTWWLVFSRPLVFLYNALLMFLILLIFTGIFRRPGSAIRWLWILITILTYVHINKFISRGTPLLPDDLALAGESAALTQFVDRGSILRLLFACALIIFLTELINRFWKKYVPALPSQSKSKFLWRRHNLSARSLLIFTAALIFMLMTSFARNNNGGRYEDIPWLRSNFTAWNQQRNYDENGFILGFLYNLQKVKLTPPAGYSEERIHGIKRKYSKIAKQKNAERKDPRKEKLNVITILNESFYDPDVKFQGKSFKDFYHYTGGEVLPNLHKIQRQHPHGIMYSTDYGGGTANMEFEVLTSMSNYWLQTVPYTALIPRTKKVAGMASYFKQNGYQTTAVHPFTGGMYKRNIAYKKMGFDRFITEKDIAYKEKDGNSEYINDKSAYNQAIDLLKAGKKNQFINIITMQNHTPYNPGTYPETQFKVTNSPLELGENRITSIETYFETLHSSDAYLGDFIRALDQLDQKTIVLFYGDHSAGLFDLLSYSNDKTTHDLSRLTPYFIYTNFKPDFPQKDLPATTPNCLGNALYNIANIKKPTINYLLDEICQQAPILTPAWFNGQGVFASTELSSYEQIIYDQLGGKFYWDSKKAQH